MPGPLNLQPSKPEQAGGSSQSRLGSIVSSLRDVYGILKNGLRRYEITEPECQSRIICEIHQKAVGRSSVGSFASSLLDILG